MAFDSAKKIIDIYSKLLVDSKEFKGHEKYGYSALKGYDRVDVCNAIKLMIAYRYFTAWINEELETEKLNNYIDMAEGSLMGFSIFFPDEIVFKLSQIDQSDKRKALLEQMKITQGSENYEWKKFLDSEETLSSFFEFCESIGKGNSDFWEIIYQRIGITWETNNSNDKIYEIIKNKDYYFKILNDKSYESAVSKIDKRQEKQKNWFNKIIDYFNSH